MSACPAPQPALVIQSERPEDGPQIDALIRRAFGPGHHAKASERVREFAAFAPELSFCAWSEGALVGVVRQWRVRVGETPLVFLGPLAVDPETRSAGVGGLLVARACEAAEQAGEAGVLLVGDAAYFQRFGFSAAAARAVRMPGPVDQGRVLVRAFRDLGEGLSGAVRAL